MATKNPSSRNLITVLNILIMALVGVGAFFAGTWYFAKSQSTQLTLAAKDFSADGLTVYRPASGILDTYLTDDKNLPTVTVPVSSSCTFINETGEKIGGESFSVEEKAPKYLRVTIGPDGTLWSIKELGPIETVLGEVEIVENSKIRIGGEDYYARGALFIIDNKLVPSLPVSKEDQETNTAIPGDITFPISDGDIVRVDAFQREAIVVQLTQEHGILEVESREGSSVFVDGWYRGTAPGEFKLAPGSRKVLVTKAGYREYETTAQINPGESTKIKASLNPLTGFLNLNSVPDGASVYIDQEFKGITPVVLELSPGQYGVRVECAGYLPHTQVVEVMGDLENTLSVSLLKADSNPITDLFTVTRVDTESLSVEALDDTGKNVKFTLTDVTRLDGWRVTQNRLSRLRPGEILKCQYDPSGKPFELTTVYTHSFSYSGTIMQKSGDRIFLGPNWVECSVNMHSLIRDDLGPIGAADLKEGDVVSVYGVSKDDIRYVQRLSTLGERRSFEGFVVRSGSKVKVFNDVFETAYDPPLNLTVADSVTKQTYQLKDVPQGSRLKFYLDKNASFIWANVVYWASVSLEGTLCDIEQDVLYVGSDWERVVINIDTTVFVDDKRTYFYNLELGDTLIVGGPSADDIRFILVTDRLDVGRKVPAVVVSTDMAHGNKMLAYELNKSMSKVETPLFLDDYGFYPYSILKQNVAVKDLIPGDRLYLYVDGFGKPVWGEVLQKQDGSFEGRYLGTYRGRIYFSGFHSYEEDEKLLIVGLPHGHGLNEGAKVVGSYRDGRLTYLEVQESLDLEFSREGTVLSVGGGNIVLTRNGKTSYEYECDQDVWFVDWAIHVDGPVSNLFPGDEIEYHTVSGKVYWVVRDFSYPFKAQGTIERIQGSSIVIGNRNATQTIVIEKGAIIYKDGIITSRSALSVGDRVSVAGPIYDSIEVVVVER